ncbi:hypothetical protein HK102_003732, partial [Quaeritorhiza haematococci]
MTISSSFSAYFRPITDFLGNFPVYVHPSPFVPPSALDRTANASNGTEDAKTPVLYVTYRNVRETERSFDVDSLKYQ